jgi:hypothetical protein
MMIYPSNSIKTKKIVQPESNQSPTGVQPDKHPAKKSPTRKKIAVGQRLDVKLLAIKKLSISNRPTGKLGNLGELHVFLFQPVRLAYHRAQQSAGMTIVL